MDDAGVPRRLNFDRSRYTASRGDNRPRGIGAALPGFAVLNFNDEICGRAFAGWTNRDHPGAVLNLRSEGGRDPAEIGQKLPPMGMKLAQVGEMLKPADGLEVIQESIGALRVAELSGKKRGYPFRVSCSLRAQ